MPQQRIEYSVLLSSPSDLADERKVAEEVILEVSKTWGIPSGAVLRLLSWENDVAPQFGSEPQDVINKSLGENWDIYLGLMHGRFGTPTRKYGSGTEEEFDRAYRLWENDQNGRRLMFYFKKSSIDLDQIDLEQLSKVRSFQKKISLKGGLYGEFTKTEDFRDLFRVHLTSILVELHKNDSLKTLVFHEQINKETELTGSNEVGYGFLDHIEISRNGLDEMTSAIKEITTVMNISTTEMTESQQLLTESIASGDIAGMRKGVTSMSNNMYKMAKSLAESRRSYALSSRKSIESLSYVITIIKTENSSEVSKKYELYDAISFSYNSIEEFVKTLRNLEKSLDGIPHFAKEFTSAKIMVRGEVVSLRKELNISLTMMRELQGILN